MNLETGKLCLDFANTMDWHASEQPEESLNSYPDLVVWAQRVGLLDAAEARRLLEQAGRRPEQAQAVLEEAIALREAIYHIFSGHAHGREIDPADLEVLNRAVSQAYARSRLAPANGGFAWDEPGDRGALDWMLWPVARSAAELLTSPEVIRVGECADETGCGWLFFDTSRNRSRMWCDMSGCGNRAKARRHYRRMKAEQD